MTIYQACDYIILKAGTEGCTLNVLKLQKLLYYTQAWSLALRGGRAFDGEFAAWIHGPVNREIYDRFKNTKMLYDVVDVDDISPDFSPEAIDEALRQHIDEVLDVYNKFSGSQLETLTHNEDPWISARGGCAPTQRCENLISEDEMKAYYSKLAAVKRELH